MPGRARIRAPAGRAALDRRAERAGAGGRPLLLPAAGRPAEPAGALRAGGARRRGPRPDRSQPLDAQGTTALDWFYPSEDGRLLAYGLSENGSEQSVLHVLEVTRARRCPIGSRARARRIWPGSPTAAGSTTPAIPRSGEVPEGEEHYHRSVFFHRLGTDPAGRPAGLPARRRRNTGRESGLSPDGRWLRDRRRPHVRPDRSLPAGPRGRDAAGAGRQGSAGHLRRRGRPRPAVPAYQSRRSDLPALSGGPGAARARGLAGDRAAASGRRARRVPDRRLGAGAELPGASRVAASSRRPRGERGPRGGPAHASASLFGLSGEWDGDELFYGFTSYTVPPTVYRLELPAGTSDALAAGGRRPGSEPLRGAAGQLSLAGRHRGDDVRRPPAGARTRRRQSRRISADTAGSTSA